MATTVSIAPRAERDIDEIVTSLAAGGRAWFAKLRNALNALDTHPARYALADEAEDLGIELREMLIGKRRSTFRVLFTIDGSTVNVHHVRRATRGPVRPDDIS